MACSLAETEICCDCILCLRPSSLRVAFSRLCDYLNSTVWGVLCRHFLQIKFLCDNDMEAICRASQLNRASPSQEMLLRLEKRKAMTVGMLLRHMRCACEDPHFKCITSLFSPLHTKDCPVYSVTAQYFNPMPLQSCQFPQNGYHNGGHSAPATFLSNRSQQPSYRHEESLNYNRNLHESLPSTQFLHQSLPNTQSLHLESMNNLSDPFKPYLVITQHPTSETLPEGDILLLKCMAESDASIKYSWKKDGKLLEKFNDKILMIPCVTFSDRGQYSCIAKTDTLQVVSNTAEVIIERIIETPAGFFATEKFALLIANEQYKHNQVLSSTSKDVLAIAATLRDLGFKTVTFINLKQAEMVNAVATFSRYLKDGAYCVTYLAGHGFENDGQCYIVPVDAPLKYTADHCFSIKCMIEQIRSSYDLNLAVFLLDVCRKRLNRDDGGVRQSSSCTKSGNFVISYATMEHGMAFEVKGHDLGVYASSLINHLNKDKRITRVIELVHSDIHKNGVTNGIQRPEFISNIFEDRKLTDSVHSQLTEEEQAKEYAHWQAIHLGQKPNIYIFECGTDVMLKKTCTFSNQLLLEAVVVQSRIPNISTYITLKGHVRTPRQKILIENMQRFTNHEITIELQLQSPHGEVIDQFEDSIPIPFTEWWQQVI